jgi:hypothetical protein
MARLVVGILIGLVLGLYLDSATTGNGAQILVQIETAIRNLASL